MQIKSVEVLVDPDEGVYQAIIDVDAFPMSAWDWLDVCQELARALAPQAQAARRVYAVYDRATQDGAPALVVESVMPLNEASENVMRALGAGETLAYIAADQGEGGARGGQTEPVFVVTLHTAPGVARGGLLGRFSRSGVSAITAVGLDGQVRHSAVRRGRQVGAGGDSPLLRAAYGL